ncbi:MAG: hypothetical protein MR965_07865 [Lachnospiraceae bacterium]|nr:hypothetical protein [Lachnospiraceae bacterium]
MGKWISDERGALTVDATLALTMTIFLIMFLVDIGKVYVVQNQLYHGMLQSVKQISLTAIPPDNAQDVINEMKMIAKDQSEQLSDGKIKGLRSFVDYDKIYSGELELSNENNVIIFKAAYDVPLTFPMFGWDKMTLKQSCEAKMW